MGAGGGGGNGMESYELPAHFFSSSRVQFPNVQGKPFIFITGDEALYPATEMAWIEKHIGELHVDGVTVRKGEGHHEAKGKKKEQHSGGQAKAEAGHTLEVPHINTEDIFRALMAKFHVVHCCGEEKKRKERKKKKEGRKGRK